MSVFLARRSSRIGRGVLLTHDEEMNLSRRTKAGHGRTRTRFIKKYLGYIMPPDIGTTSSNRRLAFATTLARDRRRSL